MPHTVGTDSDKGGNREVFRRRHKIEIQGDD